MQSKKIIAGAISLATAFTLNTEISSAATQPVKPEIIKKDANHMAVKNGEISKVLNGKFIAIKDNAGKIISLTPANYAAGANNTIEKINTKVVDKNNLEIQDLGKAATINNIAAAAIKEDINNLSTQKPKKRRGHKKRGHRRPAAPARGNAGDLIPSVMDLYNTAFQKGDAITLLFSSLGLPVGYWTTFLPLALAADAFWLGAGSLTHLGGTALSVISGPLATVLFPVLQSTAFGSDIAGFGIDALLVPVGIVGALSSYALFGIYAGKNLSGNKAVKRAATRAANNLKATLPFFGSL